MEQNGKKIEDEWTGPSLGLSTGLILLGLIFLSLVVSSLLATLAFRSLNGQEGFFSELLLSRGPHKLMRRIAMILLIVTIPMLLRRRCWHGIRDIGTGRKIEWNVFFKGMLIGVGTMGLLAVVTIAFGFRDLYPELPVIKTSGRVMHYFLSAVVVGVLEETLTRGLLFRSLARLWGVWISAIATSLLFGVGHFVSPGPEAFSEGSILTASWNVLLSIGPRMAENEYVWLRMANLTLMGCVMCVFMKRFGTVWFIAGLHAGWVFIKLANGYMFDVNRELSHSILLGHRSDNLDSLLCTAMLLALMLLSKVICRQVSGGNPARL